MAITKGYTSSSSSGGEEEWRNTAKRFLFTPGMKFINLFKLQELMLTKQRDERKRRESLKTGRIADMKKWLWNILIKIASIFYCSYQQKWWAPEEDEGMFLIFQTRIAS